MIMSGVRDETEISQHYEILRKADKFMKESTELKMAIASDKHGMNYALKDKYGRRYEHLGFYDEKHKFAGKTVGEALLIEYEERKTKDDQYELLYIYDNTPIEVGLVDIMSTIEKVEKQDINYEYKVNELIQHSKKFRFPIRCNRENDTINKIEQLTESLHVKKIGFEYVQLEFFIPLKFSTANIVDGSDLFKELTEFNQIFINDNYGELTGYNVNGFKKRIIHNTYEVWKFDGIKMETVKTL
jgi:dimeric dUTPase (all-alpha-NTP-PPase superfamily)